MKTIISNILLTSLLVSFTAFTIYNTIDYNVDESSTLTITGTSNIHDWTADVEMIKGNTEFSFSDDGMINIEACKINFDVKSIKSSKGSTMDKKIYKALKSDNYSSIAYTINSLNSIKKTTNGFTANVKGNLTVAGTTKAISMDVQATELKSGGYEITGSKDLKMTTFDVEPPTALFGALTTADDITIAFRIILDQK